jgi:hypothetical protein
MIRRPRIPALIERMRTRLGRHSRRTWLLWLLGAVVLGTAAAGLGDPALWILLLDPEFVAVTALVGVALLRENGRTALDYLLALVRSGVDAIRTDTGKASRGSLRSDRD